MLFQLIALLAVATSAVAAPAPDRSLVEELRKGGYVLYVRHFETDRTQDDSDPFRLENTTAQRQLTDAGRAQATAFGEAIRTLKVPIGSVMCSQFQRAHESAKLMAVGEPAPTSDVSASHSAKDEEEKQRRTEALRRMLSTAPAAGTNTLVVGHNYNLKEAAGAELADVGEGEVVVFQPVAGGGFRTVARVYPPSIWTEWSRQDR